MHSLLSFHWLCMAGLVVNFTLLLSWKDREISLDGSGSTELPSALRTKCRDKLTDRKEGSHR